MRSNKTKEQIYRDSFSLFVNGRIPNKILDDYLNDQDGEGSSNIQCWIVNNMRDEIMDWCTGIGIMDAVDILYNEAKANGNLKEGIE